METVETQFPIVTTLKNVMLPSYKQSSNSERVIKDIELNFQPF